MAGIRKTVCDICLINCGVDASVENGRVIAVEGSPECPNRGYLCAKGYSNRDYIYRADRIRTPLRRVGERGEGKFRPISWDEAYTEIAARLNACKREYGADGTAFFAGYTKWFRTMLHRFAHSFGTLNYGTESSVCFQAMRMANILTGGALTNPDTPHTKLLLAWGFNPFYNSMYRHGPTEKLREKGLKIITIDPRVTPYSQRSDLHLRLRAGTDGALALYLGNYLIEHGAADMDYIRAHVHGFEEYAAYVKRFTAPVTAEITGIPVPKLEQAAAMVAENIPFAVNIGAAPLAHHRNGVQNMRAILALSGISGSYDRPGGNLPSEFSDPAVNRDCDIGDEEFIQEVRPKGTKPKIGSERFPVWSELIDEFQANDLARQILEGTPYPVKALFALGMNARMFPGDGRMFRALKKLDFFVDTDLFLTDTAKYADIVLPACSSFERVHFHSAFLGHYYNFLTVRYTEPAIPPLYEAKSDADILCELAEYMQLDDPVLRAGFEACCRRMLRRTGLTLEQLRATHEITRVPEKRAYEPGFNTAHGYATPTGKFELTSEILRKHGFEPLPVYISSDDDAPAQEYPLRLTAGGRLPYQMHSRLQNGHLKDAFRPHSSADIHPADAAGAGIGQGDRMRIETANGAITLQACLTAAVPEGAVFVFQDYPDADVNSIIGADHLDPISGFPGYRSVRCRLRREEEP